MTDVIQNPILPGFHPDPTVCRVGDDFYIANSTFEWFPGVPINHSRDLVNWQLIGHALTRRSQLDLRGIADSGGVWAPSLSYADGQFWLIYTNIRTCGLGRPFKDIGVYLTTAIDIRGPWSDPVELNSIGFDPSLFHDDDGRKWLVNMEWDFRKGRHRFSGIVIQEYHPKSQKLIGAQTKILEKPGVLTEGPNLYRYDGWYYLMLAEGGTGWNHGVSMARSRNILGPYEFDPQPSVLTSRDDATPRLQKSGHGELVQTKAGEWYLVHLASRPLKTNAPQNSGSPDKTAAAAVHAGHRCVLGRETCLQRVEWRDGWLRLARTGTNPQDKLPAPKELVPQPWPITSLRDEFDSDRLSVIWSSLRQPVDESWLSLRERSGWLRLRGRDSLFSLFTQSLIARRIQHFHFIAETCLEFSPTHFTQMAGLVCYYDTRQHFYLRVTHDKRLGKVLGVTLTDCVEPAPGEKGVSPDIGFAQASFNYSDPAADQQRTLALIRISPQAGFYFDVFRSRAQNEMNSFHDYLYHDLGQSLALTDREGRPLPLAPTGLLSSQKGCLKGYDYFKNEKSVNFAGDISGDFSARLPGGANCSMRFWMTGGGGRTIFSVTAPGGHAIRDELFSFTELPMPTLVVRQQGDAWRRPFMAVYEPVSGADKVAVTNVHSVKLSEPDSKLAACVVEGSVLIGDRTEGFSAILAQNDPTNGEQHFEGVGFSGSFGVIVKRKGRICELYLGRGQAIGETNLFLQAAESKPVNATLFKTTNGWDYASSASVKTGLLFQLSDNALVGKSWRLVRTDSNGRQEIIPASIQANTDPSGQIYLSVTCELPGGENARLSIEPARP